MTPDLDPILARLVDGDLDPAALREALARVEAAPDGWRRCALAFLEARALDDALRAPAPAVRRAGPTRRRPLRLRPALAAAVALAAFGAGWLAGPRPAPAVRPAPPPPTIATKPAAPERRPAEEPRDYRVDLQRRVLAARLPDGRRVLVPVDRVSLRRPGGASL